MRTRLRLLFALALLLLPALPASAKSYSMAGADVTIVVNGDGSLEVTELLTFDFSGSFSGAYRDIRFREGERIEVVAAP